MSFNKHPSNLEKGDKIVFKRAHPENGRAYTYRQSGVVKGREGSELLISRSSGDIVLLESKLARDEYYIYKGKSLKHKIKELIT